MGAEKSNPFPPSVAVVPVSVVVVPDRHVGHLQQVSIDGDGGNYQVGGVDLEHFKSPPGIVKLFQLIMGVVVLYSHTPFWMNVVADLCCFVTSFWLFVYLFKWNQRYESSLPWWKFEFYYLIWATIAYALANLALILTLFINFISFIVVPLTTAAYAYGAYLVYNTSKSGET